MTLHLSRSNRDVRKLKSLSSIRPTVGGKRSDPEPRQWPSSERRGSGFVLGCAVFPACIKAANPGSMMRPGTMKLLEWGIPLGSGQGQLTHIGGTWESKGSVTVLFLLFRVLGTVY